MKTINTSSFKSRGSIKFMFMLFIINLSIKSNNFNLVHIFFTISLIVYTQNWVTGFRYWQLTLIKGIPIYFNNSLHSSLCCLETFTNLLLNFSMFSSSPIEIEIEHYLNFRKKSMMLFRLYQKLNHRKS